MDAELKSMNSVLTCVLFVQVGENQVRGGGVSICSLVFTSLQPKSDSV